MVIVCNAGLEAIGYASWKCGKKSFIIIGHQQMLDSCILSLLCVVIDILEYLTRIGSTLYPCITLNTMLVG